MSNYVAFITQAEITDRSALESVIKELSANVDANEPGTTHYDWGLRADGTLMTYERFTDSDAALAHIAGFGAHAERFMAAVSGVRLLVCGHPNDELRALLAGWQPEYVTELSAFSR